MSTYELYFWAFVTSFLFVALKSWQQLNVVHRLYPWILPTSMVMAMCEVWVISNASVQGWGWIVLPIGIGSGLGSTCATWVHHNIVSKGGLE